MTDRGSKQVQATVNSFRILERLVAADGPSRVTELADAVDLSKGVVHNHLHTLRDLGYVRKTGQSYAPSFRLLSLGTGVRAHFPEFEQTRRRIDNLARVAGEVATLFVEEGGVGTCVYVALGNDAWTPAYDPGSRVPLHVNAPGKAILASLERRRVDDIVDDGLPSRTDETTTDREALEAELRSIRERGVVFCREEQFSGIVGVAAPVDLGSRAPAAAIGVCGPAERLTGRYLEEDIAGQVISAARSIRADATR